jgi:hypothetical protein
MLYTISYYIGCLLILALCAKLWRLGGDGYDLLRNPGVPIVLAAAKFLMFKYSWIALLYIPAMWGMIQAFSYGITAPPHKFWVWIFGKGKDGNYLPVEIATRATCGFFWSLPAAIFSFISGDWMFFALYVPFLTIANAFFGGLVKDVEVSEKSVGASVGMAIFC